MTVTIEFFSNKLKFQNIPKEEYSEIKNIWSIIREDYTDWVSNFGVNGIVDRDSITKNMEWKGLSVWWISPLSAKDVEYGRYLNQLMVLYMIERFGSNIEIYSDDVRLIKTIAMNFPTANVNFKQDLQFNYQSIRLYLSRIDFIYKNASLLKSIIRTLSVYILTFRYKIKQHYKYKNIKSSLWFLSSYPANWILKNNTYSERHFCNAIDLSSMRNQNAGYIMYVYKYARDRKKNFFSLYKELSRLNSNLNREVIFVESNLNIRDIAEVYFSTFLEWRKFKRLIENNSFKKLFFINNLDVSIILQDLWEKGFFGSIQYAKIHGLAIGKFLEKVKEPQTIVTYGDFFSEFRGDYFFGKRYSPETRFVSVQHSQLNRNYGAAYNRKNEFDVRALSDNFLACPSPDYCLIQGSQYYKILSKFYPEDRIEIIGSLRHFSPVKIKNNNKERLILIAFSMFDIEILISFMGELKIDKDWNVAITTHPGSDVDLVKSLVKNNCPDLVCVFYSNTQTAALLSKAQLLVCSMTNLAFESSMYKVRAIRVLPIDTYPTREEDCRILEFNNGHDFSLWFNDNKNNLSDDDDNYKDIVKEYFYRDDGKSADRLWDFLMSNSTLPHNNAQV